MTLPAGLNSRAGVLIAATFLTTLAVLPALYLDKLPLLAAAMVGLLLFALFFSRPFAALVLFAVLIPFEEVIVLPLLGTPTRLAGLIFFATYLFHRQFRVNVRALPLVAWLWLLWAFMSLSWSLEPRFGAYFQLVQLVFMAWLVADFVSRDKTIIPKLLSYYTLSASVLALLGIVNFMRGLDAGGFSQQTRTSGLEGQGVEHFAFYLLPALFSALHFVFYAKSLSKRLFFALLAGILATAILASGTRGAWLSALGGLIIVYLPRLRIRQWIGLLIVVFASGFILMKVPAVSEFVAYRAGSALESGGAGRLSIWKVSSAVFKDHPIRGVGFRNYEYTVSLQDFEEANFNIDYYYAFKPQVPHNIYLEVLLDQGLVGFLLWAIWLGRLVFCPSKDKEWFMVYGFFIAYLIGGMTNPELNRKYFWITIGMVEGLRYAWFKAQSLKYNALEKQKAKAAIRYT
ncbi:MAG: O-antigen ligase family protein [Trueperaceae bacterium]|nr:O-antigen ligase family protein [Trueperaceae bacterium]